MRRRSASEPVVSVEARYPEQPLDNALAVQLAEIDPIERIVTDHLDDNQIMWNW